jgi:hypothetical protein
MTHNLCETENYKNCLAYQIIIEKKQPCKYFNICTPEFSPIIKEVVRDFETLGHIFKMAQNYCLSDKNKECERFKLFNENKEVPKDLMMDGKKIAIKL